MIAGIFVEPLYTCAVDRQDMKLAILLFCCTIALGQTSAPPPSDQRPKAQEYGSDVGTVGTQRGTLDILSDTPSI